MTRLQRTAEQVSLLSADTSLQCLHSSYSSGSTQPSFRHSKLFGRQFLTLPESQPPSWVAKKAMHLIHKKQWALLECLPLLSVKHKIKLTKSFWNSTRQQFPNSQLNHICCLLWLQNVNSLTPLPILSLSPSIQLQEVPGSLKKRGERVVRY